MGDHVYVEKNKFPFSMMVCGVIVRKEKTPLVKCPKSVNAQSYVEMLERSGTIEFFRLIGDNAVFQQDGATCHTAASTCKWFSEKTSPC